jgi:alkanesulfonate monooxygenase SsuD/methylene tetrahydromethanopterin reductase-like flavin-dependent oxidoreductase (luciferase family)
MILFLREMFAGRRARLGDFPILADFFRLDGAAEAFLLLPPEHAPEIYVAAAGSKMLEMAWDAGDGLIVSNLSFPTALVRQGALDLVMTRLAEARRARGDRRRFTKVLHLHVSVSRDGASAKRCAKRMATGALIQGHLLKQRMLELPLPSDIVNAVRAAKAQGKSIDHMIDLIDDNLLADVGTVITGTPAECIAGIDEMLRAARAHRFDIVDIASPLGPDWDEAIELICQEIIPELERRWESYQAV